MERSWQDLSESIFTLCKIILELWKFGYWKLNLIFIIFEPLCKKPGILPCYNIHRWKGLAKNFQNQKSHCAKRCWNYEMFEIESCFYFFLPILQKLGILSCSNIHRWKVLARRFRSNNHIVERDLGTMKVLELKPKFVFTFLANCAKTRHSAVFLHTPLERSCQDLSELVFTLCKTIL